MSNACILIGRSVNPSAALFAIYFFLCCQNSILLVYLHLSSYNELTGHCHVQVNKEGEHYFGKTHKELSNFTHDRLSKCNHIDLEIAELKASLTVKQSNQLVPQAIFDKIKDLCIKLSVVIKQDALTILAALTFLEQLLKKSNVILSQAIEILENIKNLLQFLNSPLLLRRVLFLYSQRVLLRVQYLHKL